VCNLYDSPYDERNPEEHPEEADESTDRALGRRRTSDPDVTAQAVPPKAGGEHCAVDSCGQPALGPVAGTFYCTWHHGMAVEAENVKADIAYCDAEQAKIKYDAEGYPAAPKPEGWDEIWVSPEGWDEWVEPFSDGWDAYVQSQLEAPPIAAKHFTLAVDVEERAVVFADKPLLQANSFHLLAGRKAAGKGTYLSDLAARVSRGELGPRRNVVWIGSEDSRSMDLKPRLAVAGADMGRIAFPDFGVPIRLPHHADQLREIIEREIGNVGLLIFDPLSDFVGGVDGNDEAKVRPALVPLNQLADDLGCILVGVRHLTEKNAPHGILAALLGSSAWAQVPRVVLALVEDDQEDDLRHITVARGNRLPRGQASLSFRIEGVDRSDHGHEAEIPRAVWLGQSDKDLDALLKGAAPTSKTKLARDAVLDELHAAGGRMESDALDARVAERIGLKPKSVRNIRSKLSDDGLIRAEPEKDDTGAVIRWRVVLTSEGLLGSGEPDPDSGSERSW
jgi:hypothetical protein